jgi:ComF family protein
LVEKITALQQLLSLFLESRCPLCQRSTPVELCQACQKQIQRCRLPEPTATWQEPLPLFAWGQYGGALKRAIASLKYDQNPQLAQPLGRWLAQAWLDANPPLKAGPGPLVVVPIPIHPEKLKQRGFNQAELLARSFCGVTGFKLCNQGLQRVRNTDAQFGLSAEARAQNLTNAFQVGPHIVATGRVLLLDDIYTTGATARAAIEALAAKRISVQGCITLAQTR